MIVRELLTRLGFTVDDAKLKNYEQRAQRVTESWSAMSGMLGAVVAGIAAVGVGQITKVADEWLLVQGRVGLVTSSAEEQKQVLQSLYEVSNSTRQEYTATADLFSKIARNADQLKMTNQDVLALTQDVNKALIVSGASTQESKAAILQFGQALASGTLQGDELRSILENAPRLARAIADGMGVSIGQLRKMGSEGQLLPEKVVAAIRSQSGKLADEFKRMPTTIGQAMTVVGNRFGNFLMKINDQTKIFTKSAQIILDLAERLENNLDWYAGKVGGWGNLLKIFGYGLAALFAGPIVKGITAATIALSEFFLAALTNPLTWIILAVIIALDELYTWIQGGESYIGDWLGPWEEFRDKAISTWEELQVKGKWFFDLMKVLMDFWLNMFAGNWQGAYDAGVKYLGMLLDYATEVMQKIGLAIAQYVLSKLGWAGQMIAGFAGIKLPNAGVTPGAVARTGAISGSPLFVNNDISVAGVPNANVASSTNITGGGYGDLRGGLNYGFTP